VKNEQNRQKNMFQSTLPLFHRPLFLPSEKKELEMKKNKKEFEKWMKSAEKKSFRVQYLFLMVFWFFHLENKC
jgi:hypothetical protein